MKTYQRNWESFFNKTFIAFQERKSFTGNWDNGKRVGPGKMIWLNGEEYNGEWNNNLQVRNQGVPNLPKVSNAKSLLP